MNGIVFDDTTKYENSFNYDVTQYFTVGNMLPCLNVAIIQMKKG